jgi:hypothetical protein
MHDSRSGAAVMYRYGPRQIGADPKVSGGPPVAHFAVVERMLHGCDDYAPVTLPASAKVQLPDGRVMALTNEDTRQAMRSAYRALRKTANAEGAETAGGAAAADAFVRMSPPNNTIAEQVLDTVWWRRFWYFSLLGAIGFLAAWPWVAAAVVDALKGSSDKVGVWGTTGLDFIRWIDYGLGAVTGPPAHFLQNFLPSYAGPWLKIAVFYPFATTLVVVVIAIAWLMNSFLRDRIQERARLAWDRAPPYGDGYWQADQLSLDRAHYAAVRLAVAHGFYECLASNNFPDRNIRQCATCDQPQLFQLARRHGRIQLAPRPFRILQQHQFPEGCGRTTRCSANLIRNPQPMLEQRTLAREGSQISHLDRG